jgi:GNAT superfamily N-acetyltransferase
VISPEPEPGFPPPRRYDADTGDRTRRPSGSIREAIVQAAGRRLSALTLDNLADLSLPCRSCVSWELDPLAAQRAGDAGDAALEKEAWTSAVLLEWGNCGILAYIGNEPVGYVLYAPPALVPRAATFPTSPVSADAVLLLTAWVRPERQGTGIGRALVHSAARDLVHRGTRAIEAFGDARWESPACVLPADYLSRIGFHIVRPHHRWPRLRLDLRSAATWREEVEVAVERLLGSVAPEPALRPT